MPFFSKKRIRVASLTPFFRKKRLRVASLIDAQDAKMAVKTIKLKLKTQ
jgi:hypothetical protein